MDSPLGRFPSWGKAQGVSEESQVSGKERSFKIPIPTHLTWQIVGRT